MTMKLVSLLSTCDFICLICWEITNSKELWHSGGGGLDALIQLIIANQKIKNLLKPYFSFLLNV